MSQAVSKWGNCRIFFCYFLIFLVPIGVFSQQRIKYNDLYYAQQIAYWKNFVDKHGGKNNTTQLLNQKFDIKKDDLTILQGIDDLDYLKEIDMKLIDNLNQSFRASLNKRIPDRKNAAVETLVKLKDKKDQFISKRILIEELIEIIESTDIDKVKDLNWDKKKFSSLKSVIDKVDSTSSLADSLRNMIKELDEENFYNEQLINETQSRLLILNSIDINEYLAELIYVHSKFLQSGAGFEATEILSTSANHTLEMQSGLPKNVLPTQTEIIDAVAILISNRFKEEVTLSFFAEFSRRLQQDSLLKIFFPRSLTMFNSIENFIMPSVGPTWKAAFGEDIATIPTNLRNFMNRNPQSTLLNKDDYAVLIDVLITMLDQTKKGSSFFDVIEIGLKRNNLDERSPIYELLNAVNYFNENLVNYADNNNYFLTWSTYKDLDSIAIEYFKNQMQKKLSVHSISTEQLLYIIDAYSRFEAEITYLNREGKQNGIKDLTRYWTALQDIIKSIAEIYKSKYKREGTEHSNKLTQLNDGLIIINSILQMQKAIESQSWGYLALPMRDLLNVIINDNNPWYSHGLVNLKIERIGRNLTRGKRDQFYLLISPYLSGDSTLGNKIRAFLQAEIKTNAQKKEALQNWDRVVRLVSNTSLAKEYRQQQNKRRIDHITETMSFIADILVIKDSKELSKVIHSKAAPVNSYKIKRNSRFSIDLNAYPGGFVGGEWRNSEWSFTNKGLTTGFTVPVGISFSFGCRKKATSGNFSDKYTFQKNNGNYHTLKNNSISVVFTALDLAAPVAFRLFDTEAETLPEEVTFKQFFAPGAYVGWGIRNTPLVILLGAQLNPKLRSFKESESVEDSARITATLAFDIPLYNMHNHIKRNNKR